MGLANLVSEIKKCENAGAITAALAMSFICIDAAVYLGLPEGREKQGRSDFIDWVDRHLKADPRQIYTYRGIDVYGARCAVLHSFSSESDFHLANPQAKIYGYHDGGMHAVDSNIDDRVVLVGIPSFIDDVVHAVVQFLEESQSDEGMKSRIESRTQQMLANHPFQLS
jgi:hypothetical protein